MSNQKYLTKLTPWLHLMVKATSTAILNGYEVNQSSLSVENLAKRYVDFLAKTVESSTGPLTQENRAELLRSYTIVIRFLVTGHATVDGVSSIFWWRTAPLIEASVQAAHDAITPPGKISCVKYDPEKGYTNTVKDIPIVTMAWKPSEASSLSLTEWVSGLLPAMSVAKDPSSLEDYPSFEQWERKEDSAMAYFTNSVERLNAMAQAKAQENAMMVACKRDEEVVAAAYKTLDDFSKCGIVLTHDNFVQTVGMFRALDAMGLLFI